MRRLLVMAYFYPPLGGGGVHRVLSFTRYLPAHGWACTVVCAGEHDYWVRDESLLARVPAGTEVLRVAGGSALSAWLRLRGTAGSGRRSGATFAPLRALADWWLLPDSYAGWSRRARRVAAARVAAGGIDAVLSSSPPDSVHLAAADVARASGLPWVADFRDPWIALHFRKPPTAWHAARHAAMEARVTQGANLVLAASRTHAEQLATRDPAGAGSGPRTQGRWLHLPNGFEPGSAPTTGDVVPAQRADVAEHFHIVFTGTLSLMDDAGTLLAALRELFADAPEARQAIRLTLAGPYDSDWETRAAALGLGDVVRFTGPLAHAETRALQRAADLLILWKPRGEGFRTMVPGKLYEYLDSGRPVLALLSAGDEAAGLVERAGGTRLAPGDVTALRRELAERFGRWRSGERGGVPRPEWLASYTREHLAGELARALDVLVPGAHP